ncbi:MAG: hypothetical protein HXS52_04255 [Theionarchaea archaeon]|nr:hypothetical protein [Theionarchaea archaeon]MBU7037119.1 hypothetical protein [Theionarchaea archaeon]
MDIPKGEIIEARAGGHHALRELLENLENDFSGYVEVVGEDNSLGQILFFDGRPRLALFEGDSRSEGREAVSLMIEVSNDYNTEIKVHRYPLVALLLDRFPEAEVTEETLGMPTKQAIKKEETEAEVDEGLFNRREELAAVLGTDAAPRKPTLQVEPRKEELETLNKLGSGDLEELREGLMKRLNLEGFYRKKKEA